MRVQNWVIEVSIVIGMILGVCAISACSPEPRQPRAQEIEERKQEEMAKRGVEAVGFPAVVNYSEKRMMKDIIELRDQMKPTYTYIMDMNGHPHKVCDSIGYGLPYATQYTNPQKESDHSRSIIANQDPNGLYSPASADGTWIMCLNPTTKKVEPQYIEPRVLVMTFPLQ
jgi:hypothetical protein